MRVILTACALAHAICACSLPVGVDVSDRHAEPDAKAYALQTDDAIEQTIAAGRSMARDAEAKHRAALSALARRSDAVERVLSRAQQHQGAAQMPYLMLLSRIGLHSDAPREFLTEVALTRPKLPAPQSGQSGVHHDAQTSYERDLGLASGQSHLI